MDAGSVQSRKNGSSHDDSRTDLLMMCWLYKYCACHMPRCFYCADFLPKTRAYGVAQQRAPPTMLPSVTGIRLLVRKWVKLNSAPHAMPNGMRNMFATADQREGSEQSQCHDGLRYINIIDLCNGCAGKIGKTLQSLKRL